MKQLLSNKWTWIVAFLVLLNIFTLSTVWVMACNRHKKHHFRKEMRGFGHGPHMRGREFLSHELQLNEEQEKQFEKLREEHFHQMDSSFANIQKLRAELAEHLGQPNTAIDELIIKISAQEAEIQRNTFEHFNKMYALCNDDQKKILKDKLVEITSQKGRFKMRGPHHRGMHHRMPPPEEAPEDNNGQ